MIFLRVTYIDLAKGVSDSSIWHRFITKIRFGLKAGVTPDNLTLIKMVGFEEEVLWPQEWLNLLKSCHL